MSACYFSFFSICKLLMAIKVAVAKDLRKISWRKSNWEDSIYSHTYSRTLGEKPWLLIFMLGPAPGTAQFVTTIRRTILQNAASAAFALWPRKPVSSLHQAHGALGLQERMSMEGPGAQAPVQRETQAVCTLFHVTANFWCLACTGLTNSGINVFKKYRARVRA